MSEKTKKNRGPASSSKHYYRKRVELFRLIDKIKLWPSRRGVLHGGCALNWQVDALSAFPDISGFVI